VLRSVSHFWTTAADRLPLSGDVYLWLSSFSEASVSHPPPKTPPPHVELSSSATNPTSPDPTFYLLLLRACLSSRWESYSPPGKLFFGSLLDPSESFWECPVLSSLRLLTSCFGSASLEV